MAVKKIELEILRTLSDSETPLSSKEIAETLSDRGIFLEPRTIRYHLQKMDNMGLTKKPVKYKRVITEKGREVLRRDLVFERVGEFSERVEYNVFMSTFDIEKMEGTIPTNIAIVDKKNSDKALRILGEVSNSKFIVSKLITIADENEKLGDFKIPRGKFGIGVVSNTIHDVILRKKGVVLNPEASGIIHIENHRPQGFSEIISYFGTTLSPGWLFVKSGLTSALKAVKKGEGHVIAAIRSFNIHAIDIVKKEIIKEKESGIGGIITVSYPSENLFSIPSAGFKVKLVVYAGLNYLAPLQELGMDPEIHINEALIDFSSFRDPEDYI
jgi:hypothetical protein